MSTGRYPGPCPRCGGEQAFTEVCVAHCPDGTVSMGTISGLSGVARELLLHLGVDPRDHPGLLVEVEQALGEETLDLGRAMLAERGLLAAEP